MAALVPGRSWHVTAPELVLAADLPPGRHRFGLVVMAVDGRESARDVVIVEVRDGLSERTAPTGP